MEIILLYRLFYPICFFMLMNEHNISSVSNYIQCHIYKLAEYKVKGEQIDIPKKRYENMDSRGGEVTY
jgi:hypothetical protein